MATRKQIAAARRNIKKAQAARRRMGRTHRRKYKLVEDFGGRKGLRKRRRR